jgi:hypothetical protein
MSESMIVIVTAMLTAVGSAATGAGPAPTAAVQARPEGGDRRYVPLPAPMKAHMMENMRDHLTVLGEIQRALAARDFDKIEDLAEQRLGISSFQRHGASHLGSYMPEGMRRVGNEMHRAASDLALKAKEGDLQATLAGLADVTSRCVACHATYRVN